MTVSCCWMRLIPANAESHLWGVSFAFFVARDLRGRQVFRPGFSGARFHGDLVLPGTVALRFGHITPCARDRRTPGHYVCFRMGGSFTTLHTERYVPGERLRRNSGAGGAPVDSRPHCGTLSEHTRLLIVRLPWGAGVRDTETSPREAPGFKARRSAGNLSNNVPTEGVFYEDLVSSRSGDGAAIPSSLHLLLCSRNGLDAVLPHPGLEAPIQLFAFFRHNASPRKGSTTLRARLCRGLDGSPSCAAARSGRARR
jgi:hypothetical protein